MKKFLVSLAVMACIAVLPASAQGISFGVKGGVTRANMTFDRDEFFSKGQYGWFIGPSVKIGLPLLIGADGAVLYDQREVKLNDQYVKMQQIVIPVNARMDFDFIAGTGLYLALGPQVGFNVGSSEFKWNDSKSYNNTFQLKKSSFSLNFGAGVILLKQLEVGFAYNLGLGKTADVTFDQATKEIKDDTAPKSWQISAAYYF